jgi:cell division protein FtsB
MHVLRWVGLAIVVAIAVAYVQPIRAYLEAKDDVQARRAERAQLLRERATKKRELAISATDAYLEREARRLGLVREGERLFVVSDVRESAVESLR